MAKSVESERGRQRSGVVTSRVGVERVRMGMNNVVCIE